MADIKIGPVRKNAGSIVAHIEIRNCSAFAGVRDKLSDVCELWIVDYGLWKALPPAQRTECYVYNDERIAAIALADAMQMLGVCKALLIGPNPSQFRSIKGLVDLCGSDESADALVACSQSLPAGPQEVSRISPGGVVFLMQAAALSEAGFRAARACGLAVWRVDCGAALVSEVERILITRERFQGGAGTRKLPDGRCIVAGGVVGEVGDIIVDHSQRPRFILGEADGCGGIRPLQSDIEGSTQRWIIDNWKL
jgi:hypothetical protein